MKAVRTRFLAWVALTAVVCLPVSGFAADDPVKKVSGSDNYLRIEPVVATVVGRSGQLLLLQVEAGLEVKNGQHRRQAEAAMPRIRASCGEALRTYIGARYTPGGRPDGDAIAASMQDAVDAVLGADVADLLLSVIVIHAQ